MSQSGIVLGALGPIRQGSRFQLGDTPALQEGPGRAIAHGRVKRAREGEVALGINGNRRVGEHRPIADHQGPLGRIGRGQEREETLHAA